VILIDWKGHVTFPISPLPALGVPSLAEQLRPQKGEEKETVPDDQDMRELLSWTDDAECGRR